MEMSIIFLGVALLGVWLVVSSKRWKTLLMATGPDSGLLHAKYAHLKSNNVKCKLVTHSNNIAEVGIMEPTDVFPNGAGSVTKLKVHEKDMVQAKELLEEFTEAV